MANESNTPKFLNLSAAAEYLGIQPHSLRTALRKGRFGDGARKAAHPTMPKVTRWEISINALDEYAATSGGVGQRPDGRNKYVIYLTQDEFEVVTRILQEAGYEDPATLPTRANPPKSAA